MKPEMIELFKSTAAKGEEGELNRQAFAAELTLPIGAQVFAESTIRQIFWVDELAPGAPANYPKDDNEINAIVMPGKGAVPQNIIGGDELFVQTFEIATSAEWKIQYARDGRHNVVEREIARMKDAIVREENLNGWATIKAAVTEDNTVSNGDTSLTKTLLNMAIAELDGEEGYKADLIVIHPRRSADFREWANDVIDSDTYKDIHTRNSLGSIWGIDIMTDFNLDEDEFYVFDTSKLGVMPVRHKVEVHEDATAIRRLRQGYIAFEEVGFAVTDANAVVKGVLS